MMYATDVIGYTADADYYCDGCAAKRYGPDYRCATCGQTWPTFAATGEGTMSGHYAHSATNTTCVGSAEPTDREDSEGNLVRPVFGSDEWWEPTEDGPQVLTCAGCGAELDRLEDDE